MKKLLILFSLAFLSTNTGYSQVRIATKEVAKHIGDSVILLDKVYGAKVLDNGMTLLNLGAESPNQLVLVINANDRAKFAYKPEVRLPGKQVFVSGRISSSKGKPQLLITNPKQISEIQEGDPRLILKKIE